MKQRRAGILLHPTSLPGRFGIGDLGLELDRFLDWAQAAGMRLWQTLPLGPPVWGGCPYSSLSTFAGNPMLVSPELLVQDGLLTPQDLADTPVFPAGKVDFAIVEPWKNALLSRSWERFETAASPALRTELEAFLSHPDQCPWLDDWTFFSALKKHHGMKPWQEWDVELARRLPKALAAVRERLADEIAYHGYLQFLFFRQWRRVREEAHRRGLEIMGDVPIYVSTDSAEVWARPELFDLDEEGRPRHVAGVPPDYFSKDGQLWGNPLYRWERMAETGYRWWIERLAASFRLADVVRIDHFRGFCDFWQVPAGEKTARPGRWVEGPGMAVFEAIRAALGEPRLVAEDLGDLHAGVEKLRRDAGLPGMRVLQFGFGSADDLHAVHNFERATVVYTGTHDNDTAVGWYRGLEGATRRRVRDYTGSNGRDLHWALIRLAYTSVAVLAVVPMQDALGLGSEARMNTPGRETGNWAWRLADGELERADARRLRRLAEISGR